MFRIQSYYYVLFFTFAFVIQAKIVYLNGTEVTEYNLKITNVTTTNQPVQKWFSVFNPKNISNHSGDKLNNKLHALRDKQDKESTLEENSSNNTLSTRSGRQLQLFYAQRILNGMHLLALLAGIYLMIFVVEPVAVPPQYLAQHYYGLPWSADRKLHREPLLNLPVLERKSFFEQPLQQKPWILNNNLKRPQQFETHKRTEMNPKVSNDRPQVRNNTRPLTSRVRYVSAQQLKNATITGGIQHWSKWIPSQNSTVKNAESLYWRPSVKVLQRTKTN